MADNRKKQRTSKTSKHQHGAGGKLKPGELSPIQLLLMNKGPFAKRRSLR